MKIFWILIFLMTLSVDLGFGKNTTRNIFQLPAPKIISFPHYLYDLNRDKPVKYFQNTDRNILLSKFIALDVTKTIFWEGDSRTDQNESSSPPKKLADLYKASFIDIDRSSLNFSRPVSTTKVVSLALSGDTLQAIRRSELSQPDSLAEGATKIYILDAGGNDLATGQTAQQAFNDFQSIADAQAAKGYIIYAATICDGNVDSGSRAKIGTFNKLIRQNYPVNRIIDFAKVSQLNDFTNAKYFLDDGIHYTEAGKLLKAQIAYARLTEQPKSNRRTSR